MRHMNSKPSNASLEYKKCAGKGCDRVGMIILNVRYLNKTGLFCDYCANDLINQDLVEKTKGDSNE